MENAIGKRTAKEKLCLWLFFAAWFVFNLILCIRHETFRDEAQSWMIARDNTIPGMIKFMWQEGHPWLYHLLLWLCSHIGIPFACIKYISLGISAVAVFLLLRFAPFSTPVLCTTLLLPFMNYYPSAMARPYCLLLLGCVLTGLSWKNRRTQAWLTGIGLMIFGCSHIMCALPSFLIFAYVTAENAAYRSRVVPLCTAYLLPVIVFYAPQIPQITRVLDNSGMPTWLWIPAALFGTIAAIVCIGLLSGSIRRSKPVSKTRFNVVASLFAVLVPASMIAICVLLTRMTDTAFFSRRYALCTIPVFVMCKWIVSIEKIERFGTQNRKRERAVLNAAAIILTCSVLWITSFYQDIVADLLYPYSSGKDMADFINKQIEDGAPIIAGHQGIDTTVALYLDEHHDIIVPQTGEALHYTKWFETWQLVAKEDWLKYLEDYCDQYGYVYLLMPGSSDFADSYEWVMEQIAKGKITIMYQTSTQFPIIVDGSEVYHLFRINGLSPWIQKS